ncbi:uncharacterized protein [Leptinotarsa decemlineata]|uniref:uncharacterized protein n=1 Tax=Leptinotarsa decemlineata TaxID=7539 RepID=UPI003D30B1F1
MKRANTIDIPKALQFYEDENDSEVSDEEEGARQRRNNYYALRGPIRLGNVTNRNSVPVFEPKTESDQKFLAFINKNSTNADNNNKVSLWSGQCDKSTVWSNKFGNIKNNFEKASLKTPNNSARNFWKTQDDSSTVGSLSQFGPKISRKSARNLQQMFEEKQRHSQERLFKDKNVVTGSLTVKIEPEKTSKFSPQPKPMNKFSHAPQSAFKPISKKLSTNQNSNIVPGKEIVKTEYMENENDNSLFLYSPKPLIDSRNIFSDASKPWVSNQSEHGRKVLNIAARKFESSPQPENVPIKPRNLIKELNKGFLSQQSPAEKLSAPYLVNSVEQRNSIVRKLSDQYDNMSNNIQDICSHVRVKYQPIVTLENTSYYPIHKIPSDVNTNKPVLKHHTHQVSSQFHQSKPTGTPQFSYLQKENNLVINKMDNPLSELDQQYLSAAIAPEALAIYQHVPGREVPQQTRDKYYTSSFPVNNVPKLKNPILPVQKIEPVVQPPKLQSQISTESLHEYNAINSKVMTGPVSQNAVTVRQKSPMTRDEHDMNAAFDLKNVLQKVSKSDLSPPKSPTNMKKQNNVCRTNIVTESHPSNTSTLYSPKSDNFNVHNVFKKVDDANVKNTFIKNTIRNIPNPAEPQGSFKYKKLEDIKRISQMYPQNENKTFGVVKPMQQKPVSVTPIYNNVSEIKISQPQKEPTFAEKQRKFNIQSSINAPSQAQMLKKSDSWNQICLTNQMSDRKSSSRTSTAIGNIMRSKSSHALAVPQKQYEAGISKDDLSRKKQTMENYFSGGSKSPRPSDSKADSKIVKRSINRIKTSDKVSAYHQTSGLSRSRTLPDIVCPTLLDESNVDQAFEDLFKSSS